MTLTPDPLVDLDKLRDIGWTLWDPIGLLPDVGPGAGDWRHEAHQTFADEYDTYLVGAAYALLDGRPAAEVTDLLVRIEAEHMSLGIGPTTQRRAAAVVAALRADPSIRIPT
ncbi:hypothetical protein [Oceanicella sp. SM1341]|uniref:hypothetical protein n=1 Tax=Oceanicella sp. SM1341 TaxID=1548889 RepID=UPI000E48CE22|nr:hypothetical protein [Oceanicella sp. SM1341]